MLEGSTNKTWWDWKDSLGPLHQRPGFEGVWNYQQTHGLGLMEYLEWAEDMDLEISTLCSSRPWSWLLRLVPLLTRNLKSSASTPASRSTVP